MFVTLTWRLPEKCSQEGTDTDTDTNKDNYAESPLGTSAGNPCTQQGSGAPALHKFIESKDSSSVCP